MQKIRIDFDNPGLPQHISAVENDSQSRFFQATLYENGKAYTAPEGATYSIMYRGFGPQNQGWYDTINDGAGKRAACKVSGNVVTCEIARQALQVPGHVSIVLCVTTGKGYMLKSWPIECDCKNDRYDSTAEIQSFFYITQVSNEDWNRAIQALEELKNTIDPTLSLSGKAADAAKVGEAVNAESERAKGVENQLKKDIKDIITKTPTEEKTDVEATEIINGSIILSSGNLSTNKYTTMFVVNRYDNVNRGKYEVHGYTQGNQCLYVVKKGDEVKAYQKVGDTIDVSGTKTLDLTIEEDGCTVYVGAYETIVGWLKKYGEKKTLNNNIEVPQIDIAKITKSNLYGKKVTLNGDSIAYGQGTGGTGFMDYIAEKYSMTLDKKAVGGGTIADLSKRYPDKHCICNTVSDMAKDVDYAIFEGGYNDWYLLTQIGAITDTMSDDLDTSKFYGALESICRQALKIWKGKKIGFVITHKINDAWRTQKQEGNTYPTLEGYYDAIRKVCEKYSIPYLDLSRVSRFNTELADYKLYTYNSDGIHPIKEGYENFYVPLIERWMEQL